MSSVLQWQRQKVGLVGAVAQLGERLVRNEEVVGSTPIGSTISKFLRLQKQFSI